MAINTINISDILENIDDIQADVAQVAATVDFANDIIERLIGTIDADEAITIHVHKSEDPVVSYRKDDRTYNLGVVPTIAKVDIEKLGDCTNAAVDQTTMTSINRLRESRDELENSSTVATLIGNLIGEVNDLAAEFTA